MAKEIEMNVAAFDELIQYLEEEPRRLDMKEGVRCLSTTVRDDVNSVHVLREFERPEEEIPPCGTVACIAGAAAILSGKLPFFMDGDRMVYDVGWSLVEPLALDRLGITQEQGDRLFYIRQLHIGMWRYWPDEFAEAYLAAKNSEERVKIAVERIRHFVATDGRE